MASGSEILERQVADLKTALKAWEKGFAAENGGKKPSREDIKKDASISAKYREYDRLRRPTSFAKPAETPRRHRCLRPESAHKRTALRERTGNAAAATTPKRAAKTTLAPELVQEEEPDVEPTPAFIRSALGPTPQKDGQVLGIFDLPQSATPSKRLSMPSIAESPTAKSSPSKRSAPPLDSPGPKNLSTTPQSTSKRRWLDAFAGTPLKRKHEEDGAQTPGTAKRQYSTPSFLKRTSSLAPIEEEDGSGPLFKKPRKGMVRSLSSLIQNLRKQEEERMDDEWDILNDLEAEEQDPAPSRPSNASKVLVEDSQVQEPSEMPLGPDRAPESEEEGGSGPEDGGIGPDGKPRKPWKKKGLKRQTRRVIMRPVMHRPKKAAELDTVNEEDEVGDQVVEETQLAAGASAREGRSDDDYDSGGEGEEASDSEAAVARKRGRQKDSDPQKDKQGKASNGEKSTGKKISATAHANFRALKIKNKNSKAGGRGRFGRR
ncbi:hypothetical protein KC315_g6844 [Hortaea werneckii]|nr:hypothetical protein KC342_g200 [Hortaea werneckii]KAI7109087.1 hypothetical protein KC339_g1043 [Hortaea werneckii]KAI7242928.1 hypothetical protein KC365_g2736 [Hortaea werneckii]KAI7326076.1 hypothetical protein KC340_g5955 [Hortaea werneckii]KAI7327997.1 hypothetical protein KC315_g6844 [Hortaea werneckii]